jgi:heme-degrading monooxygenase HmoA
MYIVIYEFKVKENNAQKFIDSWTAMTNLLKLHEGSLGSRLHKQKELHYMAYAQWPSKEIFDNSGKNLSENVSEIRKIMKNSCEVIKVLHYLEVVEDLLN